MSKEIMIDGVVYVPFTPPPRGTREVVVIDRGWIFAGDVEDKGDRLILSRALNVQRWTGNIGFGGMIDGVNSENVVVKPIIGTTVEIPAAAVLFRVGVSDSWGL